MERSVLLGRRKTALLIAAVAIIAVAVTRIGVASQGGPAHDGFVQGTTAGGTEYRLEYGSSPREGEKQVCTIELSLKRPGRSAADEPHRICEIRPRPQLRVFTVIHCSTPRETFLFGRVPASTARLTLQPAGAEPIGARLTRGRRWGSRLYVVVARGVVTDSRLAGFARGGTRIWHEGLDLGFDPCADGGNHDTSGWFGRYG